MLSVMMCFEAAGSVNVLFMLSLLSVFISSDLHDKGQVAAQRGTGQQTALGRPTIFPCFL